MKKTHCLRGHKRLKANLTAGGNCRACLQLKVDGAMPEHPRTYKITAAGCYIPGFGTKMSNGMLAMFDGRAQSVRRAMYQRAFGPIPPAKTTSLLCEEQMCINPNHVVVNR